MIIISDQKELMTIKLNEEAVELLNPWCDDEKHCDYGKAMEKFLIDFDKIQEEHDEASNLDNELTDEQQKILNNLDKVEKQLRRCMGVKK